jgi:hypothetical protein
MGFFFIVISKKSVSRTNVCAFELSVVFEKPLFGFFQKPACFSYAHSPYHYFYPSANNCVLVDKIMVESIFERRNIMNK